MTDVTAEIAKRMPVEDFVRIQKRLEELRKEEEEKLKALADLQKYYLAAGTDSEREAVKNAVGKIREISKMARQEIRSLNNELVKHMSLQEAKSFWDNYRR